MADNKKSVNFLPEYLKTDKNSKFLSATLDPLIQTPQLERIDGFVGSKITPNYDPTADFYIKENSSLRTNYSLNPALVFKDLTSNVTDVVSYDDIINEINIQGGKTDNLDRLFRTKFYSYNPYIEWDKLVNYSQYYWLPNGPDSIIIDDDINVETTIIGNLLYTMPNGYNLSNGMKIKFSVHVTPSAYQDREFYVEGVGNSIYLVPVDNLIVNESFALEYNETFDGDLFDYYPFDGNTRIPLTPEYVTINRASRDLNSWSRYNRWFHGEIIRITAEINKQSLIYPLKYRAQRPIVEFKPNIQLFNFGTTGIKNVDLIDNRTINPFAEVNGTVGYYIDKILLEDGQRVIFNAAADISIKSNIYKVRYDTSTNGPTLYLDLVSSVNESDSVEINFGDLYKGTSWYYNGTSWIQGQQHTTLNQAPLFDLFDSDGFSYSDKNYYNTGLIGCKIFGYEIGTVDDSVLGFPVKYQNSIGTGSYVFNNYFMSDTIEITDNNNVITSFTTGITYFKINGKVNNVWTPAEEYKIPVVEIQTIAQTTSTLKVTSFDKLSNASITTLVNNLFVKSSISGLTVTFEKTLKINDVVSLEITSDSLPNSNGFYKTPLSLTNNPLNNPITYMTLTEISDHVRTMIDKNTDFVGKFPGTSNLRDLGEYSQYGKQLIVNENPISFAQIFLGKKEHNVVDAIRHASNQYNQFKMNLLKVISGIGSNVSPVDALDMAVLEINTTKDSYSSYYRSDMLGYGSDKIIRTYTVSSPNNIFPTGVTNFDPLTLSFQSILVYLNDVQLVKSKDYTISAIDDRINFSIDLQIGDVISIVYYPNTIGSFVPATPSKLGLYPAYEPMIYNDHSYIGNTVDVIIGHDGSMTKAYGDYRDAIILEYEKRVYNNIKVTYDPSVFDINAVIPGKNRQDKYVLTDIIDILNKDFINWTGSYNIDFSTNNIIDEGNPFTWNYNGNMTIANTWTSAITLSGKNVNGYWRGIYKYFYDTDRPDTHPWEMLGYSSQPLWWDDYYSWTDTAKRDELISAIVNGYTKEPPSTKIDINYARPDFLNYIPVDNSGRLLVPSIDTPLGYFDKKANWKFGDHGPAETAWRKSSYWPFALNAAAALLDPCGYTSSMYDTSRTQLNINGQLTYTKDDLYLSPKKLLVEGDVQTAGFGVYVIEKGLQKDLNYLNIFKQDLTYLNFNLFHKLGGFATKDKLQILIDSVDPLSQAQGSILPPEDYTLLLNVSNPIKSASISGVIVQKYEGSFIVKGYDSVNSYFEILKPISHSSSGALTVGGKSEEFTEWSGIVNNGNNGLTSIEITSSNSNTTRYYKSGQVVRYNGRYYRVKVGHNAQSTFDTTLFYSLPSLPITGGSTVQLSSKFESNVTKVAYGTTYSSIQEVYDLIIGYGAYLISQGFIFDEFNSDLNEVMDWKYTGKEFLYWTTQNWADGSIITLSPFVDYLKYSFTNSVVDNISFGKYEYSLLKADGKLFPIDKFRLSRENGVCIITTIDTYEGIFFATLRSVQKEHGMVFNNTTIFNDTIYDIETGYRQRRIKLSGFRTLNWNGDLSSPGFVYDNVNITDWTAYKLYLPGTVVRYNGSYYESNKKISNDGKFNFAKWTKLNSKPESNLLPNFDYKISQFEDFYSLDIDNFDATQQRLAQHLIGYTPRTYLNNIFTNPVAQYKFYQGFIKDKGTKNAITKLSKAGKFTRNGDISINEDWAFRVGEYGSFSSYKEIEFILREGISTENPYATKLVDNIPVDANPLINYVLASSLLITPEDYVTTLSFDTYPGTYQDNNIELPCAGYVRGDDVTVTAYNKNSLLDIANNSLIKEGHTIWLGFLDNGGWTVYRYTDQSAKIAGVFVNAPGESITFTADSLHRLVVGDIISIVRFNSQVDGIYIVKDIPRLDQFTVASSLTSITDDTLLNYGALFKFENVRYNNIQELSYVKNLLKVKYGEKVWIDSGKDDKWKVYEKIKNYSTVTDVFDTTPTPIGQKLGTSIFASDNTNIILVSSPGRTSPRTFGIGSVWVLNKNNVTSVISKDFEYTLNGSTSTYCDLSLTSEFGFSIGYDYNKKLYFTGAPAASNIRGPSSPTGIVTLSTGSGNVRGYTSEGLVKIGSKKSTINQEKTEAVLLNPYPASSSRFGHSIYNNQVVVTTSTLLLVGAPGASTAGRVHAYSISTATQGISVSAYQLGINLNSYVSLTAGSQFGYKIAGNLEGSIIAISAPYHTGTSYTGVVQLFDKNLSWLQTLTSPFGTTDPFGDDVCVSSDGSYIFVSSINAKLVNESYGKVAVYKFNGTTATLYQIINNPSNNYNLKFGTSISINQDNETLAISSLGINRSNIVGFDVNSRSGETTFDGGITQFIESIPDSGSVYIFNNIEGYFISGDELTDKSILTGSRYGTSIAVTNDRVLIGAPSTASTGDDNSTVYQFNKLDTLSNSWKLLRNQPDLVEVSTINRVALIDNLNESIIEYLEIIDPLKGKIAGIASQELKFRSAFDPATYSIGLANNIVDSNTSWIDDHIGELWWDLSTVKYQWYEQGDEIFRKNNWGKLFPGSSIDVYEWVKSDLLPSEWAAQADTNIGLTKGISGQPKYPDNSSISVKQLFNNVTNSFENVYYFWVKNKVTVPDVKNRRISNYQVSKLIADPISYGLKFAEVISSDSVAFANIQPSLIGDRISINISIDNINNKISKHTEWLLLAEGEPNDVPTTLLEKKLFDSLIGHDILGNNVPDLLLTSRNRYGIGIRPQQTLFKNRLTALRNLVDFANSVLIKNIIIEKEYSFKNLNEIEQIPDPFLREYDGIVDITTEQELTSAIDTNLFKRALLECTVQNGKIISVTILDSGYGYSIEPKVTVGSDLSGAELLTVIDNKGQVISVIIANAGYGFNLPPELIVRPHTYIINHNSTYNNRWTKHIFNYNSKYDSNWTRIRNQKYNTPLYWNRVDWASSTFNKFKDYSYVIQKTSDIYSLYNAKVGDYVKINNIGDGYYAIIEKISPNKLGNFSAQYDIIYREKGTIQISDKIWNYKDSKYSYDNASLDQTLYDQIPDLEILYILKALKEDIFINDLKINWNLFFFTAVRYALTEQKLLDWAFKTSFINVVNQLGSLDQRPVYKLDNEQYYEEYIKEVKPYHSHIRSYTSKYTYLDDQFNSESTDFDMPLYFNTSTKNYEVVTLANTSTLNQQPWKSWADNYKYVVGSIAVSNSGVGYTQRPSVIITGGGIYVTSTATAEAYVSSGAVYQILVTDPGEGYTETPTVTIIGGGTVTTNATAAANLLNLTTRKNKIGLRFNRTNVLPEIGSETVSDTFICSGNENKFELSILAEPNKLNIVPTLSGRLILSTDYTIEYYTRQVNGHSKKYSRFVFLNYVPERDKEFKISYKKNIELYTAVDMIEKLYTGTFAISALMTGTVYPNAVVQGLPFNYSPVWDTYDEYDNVWSDSVGDYASAKLIRNVTRDSSVLYLDTVAGIIPGQNINILSGSSNKFRTNTVIVSVNEGTNSITISQPNYLIRNATSTSTNIGTNIIFKTKTEFNGDILVGDRININVSDSSFNGIYNVASIIDIDKFIVTATSVLSTTTIYFDISSSATVSTILSDINTSTVLLNHVTSTIYISSSTYVLNSNVSYNEISKITIRKNNEITFMPTGIPITGPYPSQEYYHVSKKSNGNATVTFYQMTDPSYYLDIYFYANPMFEFWNNDYIPTVLTTITNSVITSTFDVDPVDHTIDGDSFLNIRNGYAPEECIAGTVVDSLGINVYTQAENSYATVYSGSFPVLTLYPSISSVTLKMPFPAAAMVMVHFHGTIFDQVSDATAFSQSNQYYIEGNTIYLAPQTLTGRAGYTIISAGGNYSVLDSNMVVSQGYSTALVESLASIDDVRSAYVLVDGQEINEVTSIAEYGYLIETVNANNRRASVKVFNLAPEIPHTIEVWFFKSEYTSFNRVHEEIFEVGLSESLFTLSMAPGKSEPVSEQVIVELGTGNVKRLLPPSASYYKVKNGQRTFNIDSKHVQPDGTYISDNVFVYANGVKLRSGFEYTVNTTNSKITIVNGLLKNGDVVAVVGLIDGTYDYIIDGNTLGLSNPIYNNTLRVISFTDHDNMMIRTEVFDGTPLRRFTLPMPILNDNYIWVYVSGVPLTARFDFEILEDAKTVKISNDISVTFADKIIITTINPPSYGSQILGYRMFEDMFGKIDSHRLSEFYSTTLSQPLHHNDTQIHVVNATKLYSPDPLTNTPGVVLIDGERIEFFRKDGNILKQLRRSTLGTGPANISNVGTKVIDQSQLQILPHSEEITLIQSTSTTATTYIINKTTNNVTGDGIVFVNGAAGVDQVNVYYGGRQLRKKSLVVHDKFYDLPIVNEDPRTAYILIVGQSNIANYGDPTDFYVPDSRVQRLDINGNWELAVSPAGPSRLATGYNWSSGLSSDTPNGPSGGNMDGRIGDELLKSGKYDKVYIVNVSVGGSALGWWLSNSDPNLYRIHFVNEDNFTYTNTKLFERLQFAVQKATNDGFKFTHVLLGFGEYEGTFPRYTSSVDYQNYFAQFRTDIKNLGIDAPIFISRTSYTIYDPYDGSKISTNNTTTSAQEAMTITYPDVYLGPSTDNYGDSYRWNHLHFKTTGLNAIAKDWSNIILTTVTSYDPYAPEFSINTFTNKLSLNISDIYKINTDITIVQKKAYSWTGTNRVSLITSTATQAIFMRDKEAVLPDRYYYGG